MEKRTEDTKDRILTAARAIFSEKGYSGARIDQIAASAGVNKALIYYYFASKEAMLNELLAVFFRRSTEMLVNFVERGGFAQNPEENKQRFEEEYLGYLEANKDLVKIIVMESLKSSAADPPIFKLVDIEGNIPADRAEVIRTGGGAGEREGMRDLVTEFFTGVMPYISYLVFGDKWCSHFGMSKNDLRACFDKAMVDTHEQYHKNRPGSVY